MAAPAGSLAMPLGETVGAFHPSFDSAPGIGLPFYRRDCVLQL
jgi:hypothetical protein